MSIGERLIVSPRVPQTRANLEVDLERIQELHRFYTLGLLKGPDKHEVNPGLTAGSKENYLYFTLPCSVNFQRRSPDMWASALSTYDDRDTSFVFRPDDVVTTSLPTVREALVKYRLALLTNKHTQTWVDICNTLANYYDGNPKNVLAEYDFDVPRIISAVQHEKKHLFPCLGGKKLSNYWIFVMTQFTDAPLRNTHEISIIPDTHVIKSTIHLGMAPPGVSPARVESLWRDVLLRLDIHPTEMHSALWRWSRNGFHPDI